MNARDKERIDDDLEQASDIEEDAAEDEFDTGDSDELSAEDLDEFEGDLADGDDLDSVKVLDDKNVPSKEQSGRALEIRRAIEERIEERQLNEDLDYLDYDLDD